MCEDHDIKIKYINEKYIILKWNFNILKHIEYNI